MIGQLGTLIILHLASSRRPILLEQREQHDAAPPRFIKHRRLFWLRTRVDVFDRGHVGVLRGHRARHVISVSPV